MNPTETLIKGEEHVTFTDERGIEPAIVYCPTFREFGYLDKLNNPDGTPFNLICGVCGMSLGTV